MQKNWVGKLTDTLEEEELKKYFTQFGNVINVERPADRVTNAKKNFAFVEFDDYDPVDKCILRQHHQIDGNIVDVRKASMKPGTKQANSSEEKKLFVGLLKVGVNDETPNRYFCEFGKVTRIERPLDKNRATTRFCFY